MSGEDKSPQVEGSGIGPWDRGLAGLGWMLAVGLVGLFLVNAVSAFRNVDALLPVRPGKTAQDFDMPTLSGDRVRLSDLRGRPVLLVFWSVYCGVCHRELRFLEHYRKKHPELTVLAVHAGSASRSEIRERVAELGIQMPVLLDSGAVAAAYGVHQVPRLVLVGPSGKVARIWVGFTGAGDLDEALSALR